MNKSIFYITMFEIKYDLYWYSKIMRIQPYQKICSPGEWHCCWQQRWKPRLLTGNLNNWSQPPLQSHIPKLKKKKNEIISNFQLPLENIWRSVLWPLNRTKLYLEQQLSSLLLSNAFWKNASKAASRSQNKTGNVWNLQRLLPHDGMPTTILPPTIAYVLPTHSNRFLFYIINKTGIDVQNYYQYSSPQNYYQYSSPRCLRFRRRRSRYNMRECITFRMTFRLQNVDRWTVLFPSTFSRVKWSRSRPTFTRPLYSCVTNIYNSNKKICTQ